MGLFSTKKTTNGNTQNNTVPTIPTIINPDARQARETYAQWGVRMCAKVVASMTAFVPCLMVVYNDIKAMQARDQELQDELKRENDAKIANLQTEIDLKNRTLGQKQQQLVDNKATIQQKNAQLLQLNTAKARIDRDERLKLIIGLIILIPLTLYLFIFYSSSFYSAFFKNFLEEGTIELTQAMFDPMAISNAYHKSWLELAFIIFAPVIFLGFGFILHSFSNGKGWKKYLKMAALILTTLTFDIIIAYCIAKGLYDVWAVNQMEDQPPFNVAKAITDPNFWAVIFCGFVAYIIWGLVYGLIMSAYEKMDISKVQRNACNQTIVQLTADNQKLNNDIAQLNGEIAKINTEINNLKVNTYSTTRYDVQAIKKEMNNFFAGWTQQMASFGTAPDIQAQTTDLYNKTIATLNLQ